MEGTDPATLLIEDYCFLRYCSEDLEHALRYIGHMEAETKADAKNALAESAVVAYWRPFSGNRGLLVPTKRGGSRHRHLRLADACVPEAARALHQLVGNMRNQTFAHRDVYVQAAQIMPMSVGGQLCFGLPITLPKYTRLFARAGELRALASSVQDWVDNKIWDMEESAEFQYAVRAKNPGKLSFGTIDFSEDKSGLSPIMVSLGKQRPTGGAMSKSSDG